MRQILLVDAPTVLGWDEWRALDEESSARHLAEALTALAAAGIIADQPVEPLARLLGGDRRGRALDRARRGPAGGGTGTRPAPGRAARSYLTSRAEGLGDLRAEQDVGAVQDSEDAHATGGLVRTAK